MPQPIFQMDLSMLHLESCNSLKESAPRFSCYSSCWTSNSLNYYKSGSYSERKTLFSANNLLVQIYIFEPNPFKFHNWAGLLPWKSHHIHWLLGVLEKYFNATACMLVITSNNLQMNLRNWIGEIKLHHVYPGNRDEIMLTVDINIQKQERSPVSLFNIFVDCCQVSSLKIFYI